MGRYLVSGRRLVAGHGQRFELPQQSLRLCRERVDLLLLTVHDIAQLLQALLEEAQLDFQGFEGIGR